MNAESIIGAAALHRLREAGLTVMPLAPTETMFALAENGSTGTFSGWALRSLYFSLVASYDPAAIPYLPTTKEEIEKWQRHTRAFTDKWRPPRRRAGERR